ncbi:hypothetical protein FOZ63_031033 [Perkinsus olseni]|uniref:Class I SAM-dependent methyltransferase n=1 Tax=Perkinsus olseni TaxID=32597 RepID=A0A7J6QFR6_PEROL|nr:hypothetical protein FOZ62_013353 [Perkinsus olseni]KAF4707419.1 hypothetical protein FOZ63_031033 [Perkinsus olseni]
MPHPCIRYIIHTWAFLSSVDRVPAEDWWRVSTLDNAKSLALMFDRESRRHFMYREGNIAKSDYQLEMFFEVARSPWINTICETGFNAGHSAAVFLIANPSARLITFDLGQFEYTMHNLRLAAQLFPDRFEYVLGDSYYALPDIIDKYPDLRCDLVFVDGSHTAEGAYNDIKNFHKIANCRNWLLADDTGFKEVNTAWQRAKDEGLVIQYTCLVDLEPTSHWQYLQKPENRSWCLGFFNVTHRDGADCPTWFPPERNPYKSVTKLDIL